jgi:hypothetical protein
MNVPRPKMLARGYGVNIGNVTFHNALSPQKTDEARLTQPSYSPEWTSCTFHWFRCLKTELERKSNCTGDFSSCAFRNVWTIDRQIARAHCKFRKSSIAQELCHSPGSMNWKIESEFRHGSPSCNPTWKDILISRCEYDSYTLFSVNLVCLRCVNKVCKGRIVRCMWTPDFSSTFTHRIEGCRVLGPSESESLWHRDRSWSATS